MRHTINTSAETFSRHTKVDHKKQTNKTLNTQSHKITYNYHYTFHNKTNSFQFTYLKATCTHFRYKIFQFLSTFAWLNKFV